MAEFTQITGPMQLNRTGQLIKMPACFLLPTFELNSTLNTKSFTKPVIGRVSRELASHKNELQKPIRYQSDRAPQR